MEIRYLQCMSREVNRSRINEAKCTRVVTGNGVIAPVTNRFILACTAKEARFMSKAYRTSSRYYAEPANTGM